MKKVIVTVFLTICLAIMMVGCGDKNNSATAPTNAPQESAKPTDHAGSSKDDSDLDNKDTGGTGNDMSDDVKDAADGIGDGVKDAVDGAEDAVDGAVDGAKDAVDGMGDAMDNK